MPTATHCSGTLNTVVAHNHRQLEVFPQKRPYRSRRLLVFENPFDKPILVQNGDRLQAGMVINKARCATIQFVGHNPFKDDESLLAELDYLLVGERWFTVVCFIVHHGILQLVVG